MTTITVRRGKTAGIPFHQERAPVPLVSLRTTSMDRSAALVAQRVESISRHRGCCAFVFVRDGLVYVISEESSVAHRWAVERTAEWVGCYGGMIDVVRMVEELQCML